MKKAIVLTVIMVFAFSTSVLAAGKSSSQGKPMSKYPDKGLFNACSAHIANWGKSSAKMKDQSLRGTKTAEAKKGTEVEVK